MITTLARDVLIPAPPSPPGTLRMMVWNLLRGGVDGQSEARLFDQLLLLGACAPDVLCLPEATGWHLNKQRLLHLATGTLGMKAVTLARTRVGDGKNYTALLYNPASVRLINWGLRGVGVFHHALIRAKFRPQAAGDDPGQDFMVYATHLNPLNGEARLNEVSRWLTDAGGPFPSMPARAVALGDFDAPDREPGSWDLVPKDLHRRYRLVLPDGSFGGTDQRALQVLLNSGWTDPHTVLGLPRPPTVGHFYDNGSVAWALDYTLLSGLRPVQVWTHPFDKCFRTSNHFPSLVDVAFDLAA